MIFLVAIVIYLMGWGSALYLITIDHTVWPIVFFIAPMLLQFKSSSKKSGKKKADKKKEEGVIDEP